MRDNSTIYHLGLDAGSTTLKTIVLDEAANIVYKSYVRHKTDIQGTFVNELKNLGKTFPGALFRICGTGSAGMGIAERLKIPFIQEVVASVKLINKQYPEIKTLLDLGGEDAKMVFFSDSRQPDIRMNGSCAGGTGAFIDQMASLMNISLDELSDAATRHEKNYPIASRCGVFAKTDVQNLISKNIAVPDIAASILHAVAIQNITTLSRGYEMQAPVLCIGGPFTFIPPLRKTFAEALKLGETDFILPENSEYFPAWGAALDIAEDAVAYSAEEVITALSSVKKRLENTLPALFESEEEYALWLNNRKIKALEFDHLKEGEYDCFLGIDSGSTTTKIVVIDNRSRLLYHSYGPNQGNALRKVVRGLTEFYLKASEKGAKINIKQAAVTGYGGDLIRSALNLDHEIVETMAHLKGAQYINPQVSFILDIGGQDIKSIFARDGVISNVELNEACSSGCGSFLQNFAETMHLDLNDFSRMACLSASPCDLGSRCTVFMNSKVKQALRENAHLGDIAAGLAYSVVKNCLFKVLKIANLNSIGEYIVVQGGTFRNDAVYRALELLSGKSVFATDHPELMGAFGAALYAKERTEKQAQASQAIVSGFTYKDLDKIVDTIQTSETQCKGCTNSCSILKFRFMNGNVSYAGNKCEKIFHSSGKSGKAGYNAFEHKNEFLFTPYERLEDKEKRARIGIPRVLNMFENYPFWNALLTECGFEVVLSPESTFSLYQKGVSTIMSDNICFPAKLVHGHILSLIEQQVDRIFYPIVPKEEKEFSKSNNSFNCPVVSGYPDVVRSSIDPKGKYGVSFDSPVIGFNTEKTLKKACGQYLTSLGVSKSVFNKAFTKALQHRELKIEELVRGQKELFEKNVSQGKLTFVVAGRPYHADPLVHQKTGQILADLGAQVFTDDVFRSEEEYGYGNLNIVSQWSYPNRVIQSALQIAKLPQNVQLIQLNSFGCGPDSFFMDEAASILKEAGKSLTVIRIDEIASPGSIRLRLRSLVESMKAKGHLEATITDITYQGYSSSYTKEDRQKTILIPWLCDFLSPFVPALGDLAGYKLVNLPKTNYTSVDSGLKYGHNEVCYPSTLVLGDIINGLASGNYDLDNVVVAITQTGGQCRATNYIAQIKTGLSRAGYGHIPVIALTAGKTYQNDQRAFKIPWMKLVNIAVYTILYGDALFQMYNTTRPREKHKGDTQRLFDFYMEQGSDAIRKNDHTIFLHLLKEAVADFNAVSVHKREFKKIGVIGEIFVKYNNYAQYHVSDWLRDKGIEVVSPPILDFIMQYFVNSTENQKNGLQRGGKLQELLKPLLWGYMNRRIERVEAITQLFRYYQPSESIYTKAEYASEILSLSNQFGEGWSVAGEVASFARQGIEHVVCIQPFGCIANHIVAKGIEKRLKKFYPSMNLLYLDVDGGVGEVNIQNRLHFML